MPRAKKQRTFSARATKIKLILASILLNLVILASFLTSSPQVSPASGWMTAIDTVMYKASPITGKSELQKLHFEAKKLTKERCMACHGSMIESKLVLHRIHLTSDLLPGLVCHDCHQSISLEKRSNAKVVRLVDVGFCKKCHSAFPGLKSDSPMKPEDFKADCTTCHTGKHAFKHGQPYLSQVIAPRECPGCHGGRVLPWNPAHEKDDWVQAHGLQALKVGVQSCMKCHEFGLAFCNECHSRKPPSHEPRDRWLQLHRQRAKQETRTCFTCHVAKFCKRCHVNHTPGWRERHFKFVVENGTDLCEKCHSVSFCSSCHIGGGPPIPQ